MKGGKSFKSTFMDRDSGFNTLMTSIQAAKGRAVFVGFLRSSGQYKGKGQAMSVAQVAAIHEFGSHDGKIPQRSFMRTAVDENKQKITKLIDKLVGQVVDGKKTEVSALRILGAMVQALMRDKILRGPFKPNAPGTIRRKGSGKKPLIDTSQMINSIDFEVIDAKGKSGGTA